MSEIDDIKKGGFDVGVSDNGTGNPSPPPEQTKDDPNSGLQPGMDVSVKTKRTLAQYLGKLTTGQFSNDAKNYYPLDGSTIKEEKKLVTPQGSPAPLSKQSNPDQFTNGQESSYSEDYPNILNDLSKGRTDEVRSWNGNTLLSNVTPSAADTEADQLTKKYVSPALSKNRFTPGTPR